MRRYDRPRGIDSLMLFIGVIIGIAFYGPALALKLKMSLGEMTTTLAPIIGPLVGIVLIVLVIRSYWSRF